MLASPSGVLPRRKTTECVLEADPLNKRCHRLPGGLGAVTFLSAGLGGEGEEGDSLAAAGPQRWSWEILESALLAAVPQRRRCLATAILGQKAGPAVLDSGCCSSVFFLHRRILPSLGAAFQAPALPSGLVPDVSRSGCAWRLFIVDEMQGLGHVFVILFMVFSVKVLDHVVISLFRKVLSIFEHPPK